MGNHFTLCPPPNPLQTGMITYIYSVVKIHDTTTISQPYLTGAPKM